MTLSIPSVQFRSVPILTTSSFESLAPMARDFNANALSTAWGTANQARYIPFWIPDPIVAVKLIAYNGATAGGNSDMGLYDASGNQIVAAAAALQAGATIFQEFDIVDTPLRPGLYFVGLLNTTTTGTFMSYTDRQLGRAMGVYSQAVGAGNLPSPATFAALDAAVIPIVGIALRTLI